MRREYLKKATLTSKSDASKTKDIVRAILDDIETVSYTHLTLPTICSV